MEVSEDLVLPRIRCAAVHGSAAADPVGNAPAWDAVLVVELPLPWPRDIGACEPFAGLPGAGGATLAGPGGSRWRPQAVVPADPAAGVRIMAFERPDALGGPFGRREWMLPPGSLDDATATALTTALLTGDRAGLEAFEGRRDDPPAGTVDLLVCTHGSRDACCGSSGAAVHQELLGRLGGVEVQGADGGPARLWRTSHTGGHRFAATALSLPDGYLWAHLTADLAERVLLRTGEAAEVAPHCRGSVSVEPAVAQVADREAMAVVGWDWLERRRRVVVLAHERDTLATTLAVRPEGGDAGAEGPTEVVVRVELDRHIPMPTCGTVEAPEFATEPVWRAVVL